MKKTKISPYWKKKISKIARKMWSYEADRREGRYTVECVLRANGEDLTYQPRADGVRVVTSSFIYR